VTQRVVIADAGPLIALARIEALHLLRQLFGRVCVTTTVRDEILPAEAAFADAETLVRTLAEGWIDVVELAQTDYRPLNPGVDAGEASSIQVAKYWSEAAFHRRQGDVAGHQQARRHVSAHAADPRGPGRHPGGRAKAAARCVAGQAADTTQQERGGGCFGQQECQDDLGAAGARSGVRIGLQDGGMNTGYPPRRPPPVERDLRRPAPWISLRHV